MIKKTLSLFHLIFFSFLFSPNRMEKLALGSLSTWAKILGTIVSVSGAMLVVLYKGPTIISTSSMPSQSLQWPLQSTQSRWVIGGILLLIENLLISVWYIIQVHNKIMNNAESFSIRVIPINVSAY